MSAPLKRPGPMAALALVSVLVLLYSVFILQQILLGLLLVLGFWFFYLFYLAVVRLGRIATALELMADRSTDGPTRDEFTRD
ncbi:hypothetical protein [Haloarcula salinisoli]|uniref:Uncharacterized protein n=1 Tax=Haloarcula salinisoli TaxID=2487746 RepID=A0A8J7YH44_9EURY|nr:hypothetical protein [Halomicroarcula salinisoli]MBX0285325.1 hypothetical protein [Halomicroarcula salinisoli]MBX0303196.1 hypothetical protein [Halomicroarcula salinisoli]